MVNLHSRSPFGGWEEPFRRRHPTGHVQPQSFYGYPTGYDDSHYYREMQRRALLEERRRQQVAHERRLYEEMYHKRMARARAAHLENEHQKKIAAFKKKMSFKKLRLIQRWWRSILCERQARREQAASLVITRTMQRFMAMKEAQKIAHALRRIRELTTDMDTIAPVDQAPPVEKKQRLFVEGSLEKIVLKVDLVDTHGSMLVRSQRKQLVLEVNQRLKQLDESGPTMLNSPMLPKRANNTEAAQQKGNPTCITGSDELQSNQSFAVSNNTDVEADGAADEMNTDAVIATKVMTVDAKDADPPSMDVDPPSMDTNTETKKTADEIVRHVNPDDEDDDFVDTNEDIQNDSTSGVECDISDADDVVMEDAAISCNAESELVTEILPTSPEPPSDDVVRSTQRNWRVQNESLRDTQPPPAKRKGNIRIQIN